MGRKKLPKAQYKYFPADTEIIFNDGTWMPDTGKTIDPGIAPIIRALPMPPPAHTIAGFGLAPEEQYFEALFPNPPSRLQELIDDIDLTNEEKISRLDENPEYYQEEIEYILWHQKVCREGWWFFNKGKPICVTHDHVYYLSVWQIEDYHPEFRIRDWEVHWAIKLFCDDDPLCLGINRPKERQIGETNIVCSLRLRRTTMIPYFKTYMQSKDAMHAKTIHELLIYQNWRNLPFYLAPNWDGDANSVSEIRLYAPKFPKRPGYKERALNSILGYRDSSEKALDGIPQIDIIHNDEIAKAGSDATLNVHTRWEKQKYCLKHGANKTGFAINTSTVDEMLFKGGKEFKLIADQSHCNPPIKQSKDYPEKTREQNNGWTVSGLYNVFIPSNEGFLIEEKLSDGTLRRSIDKYGYADLRWTTKYLIAEREAKKSNMLEYLALLKERPLWWDECFLYNVNQCNFDLKILRERLEQLAYASPRTYQRGNFVWKDGVQYGLVEWVEDNENGRWYVSKFLPDGQSNSFEIIGGKKSPNNWLRFVAGCDPYKFGKKKGSDGGGSVFWKRDFGIDPGKKEARDFKSYNWVCTYSHRHRHLDQYADDMLMMCQYFGCKMAEETNFSYLNNHFERVGYGAYLHHFYDDDGMQKESPGQDSQNKQTMEYFRILNDFISKHGLRVNHPEILEDCMNLQDDFGPYDRLVSCSLSLKAAMQDVEFNIAQKTSEYKPDKTLERYYSGIPLNTTTWQTENSY